MIWTFSGNGWYPKYCRRQSRGEWNEIHKKAKKSFKNSMRTLKNLHIYVKNDYIPQCRHLLNVQQIFRCNDYATFYATAVWRKYNCFYPRFNVQLIDQMGQHVTSRLWIGRSGALHITVCVLLLSVPVDSRYVFNYASLWNSYWPYWFTQLVTFARQNDCILSVIFKICCRRSD